MLRIRFVVLMLLAFPLFWMSPLPGQEKKPKNEKKQIVQSPTTADAEGEPILFGPRSVILQEMPLPIQGVAFSRDGKLLAIAAGSKDSSGELRLLEIESKKTKVALKEARGIRSIVFSPDGKLLA